MSQKRNWKEMSKSNWTTEGTTPDHLIASSLMRIADSTEVMAKNYVQLQKDATFWEKEFRSERERRQSLERSIVAHKANYTRLKNKIANK